MTIFICVFLGWAEVDATKWTGARNIEKPGVNTERVKFVVAGEDTEGFTKGEVFGAD